MSILNEALTTDSLSPDVLRTFIGGKLTKQQLNASTLMYKFTDAPLVQSSGRVSPWWSSVEPIAPGDTGLAGLIERAKALSVLPADFARARSAVTKQWNSMSNLLVVRLQIPAYGFVGRCSSQQLDNESPALKNVVFIGGAWQIFLPNLATHHVVRL
jgi:hypothetical protein